VLAESKLNWGMHEVARQIGEQTGLDVSDSDGSPYNMSSTVEVTVNNDGREVKRLTKRTPLIIGKAEVGDMTAEEMSAVIGFVKPEKSAKLAEFMKTWGEKMGQPNYQKGIAGGDVGPDNLYTLGENSKMDAIYTDTGQGNAKYRIVERYSNWDKYPDVHSYFFAITDTGEGIVFHSPTTNGGKMYLKPTDNKELQEEFTQLLHQ